MEEVLRCVLPWRGLGLFLAGDVLGGDGQEGAVHVLKGGEEGGEGVELGGGDVAEVHRVEHHQHVLAAELSQVDLDGR